MPELLILNGTRASSLFLIIICPGIFNKSIEIVLFDICEGAVYVAADGIEDVKADGSSRFVIPVPLITPSTVILFVKKFAFVSIFFYPLMVLDINKHHRLYQ